MGAAGAAGGRTRLAPHQVTGFWAAWAGWMLDGMDSFIYALVLNPALTELLPKSGIAATNAPRLRGMNDWYLFTQLKNFRDGVRGSHPQDGYGSQMALFAAALRDDQSIRDLLAYIETLPVAPAPARAAK